MPAQIPSAIALGPNYQHYDILESHIPSPQVPASKLPSSKAHIQGNMLVVTCIGCFSILTPCLFEAHHHICLWGKMQKVCSLLLDILKRYIQ